MFLGLASLGPAAERSQVQASALSKIENYAFPIDRGEKEKSGNRSGIRTNGLIIYHQNVLVFERYYERFSRESVHQSWSVSKSFTNALIGVAVEKKFLAIEDKISRYLPELDAHTFGKEMTVAHLLSMESGFEWREGYEYNPFRSNVLEMLYTFGRQDMGRYVTGLNLIRRPGSQVRYSSGDTNLLMLVLKQALGIERYQSFPWDELFAPLDIKSAVWEIDGSGTYVGSSYFYANLMDQAKLGRLFLQDGVWNGVRILPKGWVDWSKSMSPAYRKVSALLPDLTPGRHWWTNQVDEARGIGKSWPSAPEGTFAALGHWGQSIFIVPEHELVVARIADDRSRDYDSNLILEWLIESFH
jgi:CubicO group peptidase (beta-lactamase class C family)